MSDPVDIANEQAEWRLEKSLEAARNPPPSVERGRQSAKECIECGEPIPKVRQERIEGCQLCVECAEYMERKLRQQQAESGYTPGVNIKFDDFDW